MRDDSGVLIGGGGESLQFDGGLELLQAWVKMRIQTTVCWTPCGPSTSMFDNVFISTDIRMYCRRQLRLVVAGASFSYPARQAFFSLESTPQHRKTAFIRKSAN
jgi:hypothetical protein